MSDRDTGGTARLEAIFLAFRPRLLGIAYRMLGTRGDAEDIVQEAWERWHAAATLGGVEDPAALLSTVTTRLCIDRYRRERARRAAYRGSWLPEPLPTDEEAPLLQLESERLLSVGLLRLLEHLTPPERAVFVLAEGFDYRASEIAPVVDRSEANCRQLLHRARKRLGTLAPGEAAPVPTSRGDGGGLLRALVDAVRAGRAEEAARLLTENVVLVSDGGGRVPAATRPVHGRRAVVRLLVGLARGVDDADVRVEIRSLNGSPALVLRVDDVAVTVMTLERAGDAVGALFVQRNPDKLARLARAGAGDSFVR